MEKVDNEKIKEDKSGELFWTRKEPRKSLATFQRNQNKFLVNSLNQMDRKAAMMIRTNTTLISGVVVFFEYISDIKNGALIGGVLVVCSFISLILALIAAKPPISKIMADHKNKVLSKYPKPIHNLFIVGMMGHLSLKDYEKAYDELVQNQELQIGNQVRSNYAIETNLVRGFRLLEFSYNSFITGFVFTVLVFIFSNYKKIF
ncbi:MAG: Pycsar system effector family protein [Bacteroidota bacterium]